MTLTTEQLAALEAAFEKATKGEWHAFIGRGVVAIMLKRTMREIIMWTGFDGSKFQKDNAANASFIALAHNLMPALLAAAKEARMIRAEMLAMQSAQDHLVNSARTAEAERDAAFAAGRKAGVEEAAGIFREKADALNNEIANYHPASEERQWIVRDRDEFREFESAILALIEEEKTDG